MVETPRRRVSLCLLMITQVGFVFFGHCMYIDYYVFWLAPEVKVCGSYVIESEKTPYITFILKCVAISKFFSCMCIHKYEGE